MKKIHIRNWHIVFPNIEDDILTQKRTVLHLPYIYDALVGDHILIHSYNTMDKVNNGTADFNIYADAVIKSITMVRLIDISKEAISKMNINSHQEYFTRLFNAWPEDNLTNQSLLFEIEFEYCPPLSKEVNKYFADMYKSVLTSRAALLQSTQQTENNNS